MEWTALSFDENPRTILHIVAGARVCFPVGRWRAWATPSWATPVSSCARRQEFGLGRADARWAVSSKVVFTFPSEFFNVYSIKFSS